MTKRQIQLKKELDTYLPLLSERQQKTLLDVVRCFLNLDEKGKPIPAAKRKKEVLSPFTLEEFYARNNQSMKDVKDGKLTSHKKVMKKLRKSSSHSLEDQEDILIAESRKHEKKIPFEKVIANLKKKDKL